MEEELILQLLEDFKAIKKDIAKIFTQTQLAKQEYNQLVKQKDKIEIAIEQLEKEINALKKNHSKCCNLEPDESELALIEAPPEPAWAKHIPLIIIFLLIVIILVLVDRELVHMFSNKLLGK